MSFAVFFLYLFLLTDSSFGSEPVCSRFHYEEKTLEKMIRQEIVVERMKADLDATKQQVLEALADLTKEREQFVSDLEGKTNDIEMIKETMDKTMDDVKTQNERNIEAFSAEMEKLKGSVVAPVIAFKAHVVSDKALSDNKVITFSENLFNAGDAYNNKTGEFVAPVGGVYHFSAQLCLVSKTYSYFGIVLKGRIISGALFGERDWVKCYAMDAITAVNKGDEVSVQCKASCSSSYSLWNNPPRATSSFAGVLIHRLIN